MGGVTAKRGLGFQEVYKLRGIYDLLAPELYKHCRIISIATSSTRCGSAFRETTMYFADGEDPRLFKYFYLSQKYLKFGATLTYS